jgi:putative DNA methylase
MTYPIKTPKKLIEVALPLDDINIACVREKSIRHGHPSTLHLWWARRPLAAARAVIFAQMVNDPGGHRGYGPGMTKAQAQIERERLFEIIRKLVLWENTNNETVLAEAREEIRKSWRETCALNKSHPEAATLFNPEKLPAFHDPFAGGGAIPLEAQRLGLESYASDLNPVAVLINKAMIEIPPKFAGRAPIGPLPPATNKKTATRDAFEDWSGAKGLAEDVRRYGYWMREEAFKRIGHLYPQVDLNTGLPVPVRANSFAQSDHKANKFAPTTNTATVIAWIWVRTVKSSNPAFSHVDVPLASTFVLSSKAGKEAYVQPVIEDESYHFEVHMGKPPLSAKGGTTAGKRKAFLCLMSSVAIDYNYIRAEGKAGRMGQKLMAVVAEGTRGRTYLAPTNQMEAIASQAKPEWRPETKLPDNPRDFKTPNYGMQSFGDLFTPRQLVALTTFSDLVQKARDKVKADALIDGMADDDQGLDAGGTGATAYADAVAVYLSLALSKLADSTNTLVSWKPSMNQAIHLFTKQAIPMVCDYAEPNIFCGGMGDYSVTFNNMMRILDRSISAGFGQVTQLVAQTQNISIHKVISTDPPYYDNIGYADLSDFFYVWLRRALRPVYPSLFATMAVPKAEELVATPYRHGSKAKAEKFFLDGMTEAMHRLAEQAHPAFPTTIYYAFKQSDTTDVGTGNTGWETFLEAVLRAGFAITGTWPMRTELANRMIGSGTNALASSIVLVCRQRETNATTISRREFIRELKQELTEAIEVMIGGAEGISPVAPVDLAQAVIGPGMAIFSKYAAVLEADGSTMTVHDALVLINRTITEGGDDFDADTQFALSWFDEQGWSEGEFGKADVLARAKGTSVTGVADAGVLETGAGKVRLLKWSQYPEDWSPERDNRTPVWEALHQLIRVLNQHSESAAGSLIAKMPERSEAIRQLAYRLYTLCERKGWAEDARAYNELIGAWPAIVVASLEAGHKGEQFELDQFGE